jgi:hypothetical protein
MTSLITTALLIIVAILAYRFRAPAVMAVRRFDARNRQRIEEEIGDRRDPVAHYKHTLRLAEEQVEEIGEITATDARTGQPVKLHVFEGEQFSSRDEAEAARQRSIVGKARTFYVELPAALAHRRKETLN